MSKEELIALRRMAELENKAAKSKTMPAVQPKELSPQQQAGENLDSYKAGLVGAATGASSGFNDELMAGVAAAGSIPVTGMIEAANMMGADISNPLAGKGVSNAMDQVYNKELEKNRTQNRAATEGHPVATVAGNIIGAFINPLNKVLPTGGGVVNTAMQGAALGAAQGFGEGEGGAGSRIVESLTKGAAGGAIGGAAGAVGNVLKYAGKKINPAPTVNKLKEISDKAFKYIEDSNFKFSADDTTAMSKAMDDTIPKDPQILQRMAKTGNESLSTKGMFDEIYAGKPTSLAAFRDFDSQLNDKITGSYTNFKATSDTKELYKLQNAVRDKMDEAMAKATPAVRDAYHVYSQKMKIEDIGNILDRAMKTQNPASSLKTQLAGYSRKARGLDETEKKFINDIIKDDLGDEVLRSLGSRLAGIGQVAQGNFGQALGQVALSKLSRNTLEARKLAKIDDLTNYIARKAETRINAMGYLDDVAPALPKYPKLDDIVEKPAATRGGSQGIRDVVYPSAQPKPEPQKLLPAPSIKLPDEVGKPTLDSMIPKQKLLPAPKATGEMAITRQGQAVPLSGTESAELAILRKRAADLGLTPDVRKVAESFARRTKENEAWQAITKQQQDTILKQVDEAWKQYDKTMKPSIEDMIDVMEQGAKDLAAAKGEKFNPTALFDALAKAKTESAPKSGRLVGGKNLDSVPIKGYEKAGSRPLKITIRPNLKTKIKNFAKDESGSVGGQVKSPDFAALNLKAKELAGLTDDPLEAGYILDDGKMLDLSGRHYSNDFQRVGDYNRAKGKDWLRGQRSVDHREISNEIVDGSGSQGMNDFIHRAQAVRVDFASGSVNASFIPSPKQIKAIVDGAKKAGIDELNIEFTRPDNGEVISQAFIKNITPANIQKVFNNKMFNAELYQAPLTAGGIGAAGYALSPEDAKAEKPTLKTKIKKKD